MKIVATLLLCAAAVSVQAGEINVQRAHFNYQMFCQGCHAPGGASEDHKVPRMKDHVGTFLGSREGREFLVRVPGSATSSLDSDQLAEVLNWIVLEFSGESLRKPFDFYTEAEVAELRQRPLTEVVEHRKKLLAQIASIETRE